MLVHILAAPLPMHLPVNGLGKAMEDSSKLWDLAPRGRHPCMGNMGRLLALDQLSSAIGVVALGGMD